MEYLRPNLQPAPNVKVMINVGALFDIVTGNYLKGFHGESILNGGLGNLWGISGAGNSFKTKIMRYMVMTALARMTRSTADEYDTEIMTHEWHISELCQTHPDLFGEDLIQTGRWVITDRTVYEGDKWYDITKEFMQQKRADRNKWIRKTPFMNRDRSANFEIIQPTFTGIDSLSEFITSNVIKMQDNNSLGESGANMVSMQQGMQKNRLLMEMPALAGGSNSYVLMTAQLGSEFVLDPYSPPQKKLEFIKKGVKLKGVPEKFTFMMNACWMVLSASPLRTKDKLPEYPRSPKDDFVGDTDLMEISMIMLRNKSGPTGYTLEIIASQEEGVLPSLTEFHHIKTRERYGISGTLQNYHLDILPDVSLSRTTVRRKIKENEKLCRALNITAEMCQMNDLWHTLPEGLLCTPKQLYDDLKAKGYDWDVLLHTRGWWCLEDDHPIPFLSTMDLLNMRQGTYFPYWMPLLPGMTERPEVNLGETKDMRLAREKAEAEA